MSMSRGSLATKTMYLCTLLWGSPAFADEARDDPDDGGKVVEHHGGRFSLLGMECKAEEEALETTPGSPPLDVDDPATPGCNGWEVNIVTSGELGKNMSWDTPLFDINYGIGDNLQLKAEIPYQFSKVDDAYHSGFGLAELGVKYRFYENEDSGMEVAVYPQVEFAIPGTAAADGEEGGGTLTKLPLLFSTKLGETSKGDIMITANLGYNISTNAAEKDYVAAAVGIGFPLTAKLAVMVEGSTEQAVGKNMEDVRERYFKANAGVIGGISEHFMWFGSVGQTIAASDPDDSSHTCLMLGIRVLAGGP